MQQTKNKYKAQHLGTFERENIHKTRLNPKKLLKMTNETWKVLKKTIFDKPQKVRQVKL